jgi:exportin-1
MPFIEEILNNINTIICDLEPHQVHTFYEAVGYMISAQTDAPTQEQLIEKYMHLPNIVWDSIILQATNVKIMIFYFILELNLNLFFIRLKL